nr:2,3-bisphosphoglycerate-independent phosphoglycerate mutase [FCB group bacterium]
MNKKVILVILDGFGYNPKTEGNAIAQANTPIIDNLLADYPHTLIGASGESVGLPQGQMGNSEVGHLNIGAGRIVYQDISRIDKAIAEGEFFQNEVLLDLMRKTPSDKAIHLIGLVSDGCVHSSMNHLKALLKMAKSTGRENVYIHALTDGRDTSPHGGLNYIKELEEFMAETGIGKIASVSGRYYAMDRDKRWDRIEKAYRAIVDGDGKRFGSAEEAVIDSYNRDVTDEFIIPSVIVNGNEPVGRIISGDGVVFFNFRADRTRQMCKALADPDFSGFKRDLIGMDLVTMTEYEEDFTFPIAFSARHLNNIFGEILSKAGMKQLRIAETEKYAHVTYFFNGGEETPFEGEGRILVPSPKVATYDLKPEMSAYNVTIKIIEALETQKYHAVILNYANCDMVGHTGVFRAAVKAVETVDSCVGK